MDRAARAELDRLARIQRGHLTRAQLQASGLDPSTIWRMAGDGRLVQVGRHVFRRPGVVASLAGSAMAGCLEVDGVASHRTAAWLHGLTRAPGELEVLVARRRSNQPSRLRIGPTRLLVHTTTNLPAEDVVVARGVPCTSVARTLLLLGSLVPRSLSHQRLVSLSGAALDREIASLAWLWHTLEARRCRGRNGVRAFERALGELSDLGPTESWLEREFLRLVSGAGIPAPETQRIVSRDRRFVARVDFCFDREGLVVEVLGHTYHRTRAQLASDSARANEVQLAGWRLLQFTYDQIVREPDSVVSVLRTALA